MEGKYSVPTKVSNKDIDLTQHGYTIEKRKNLYCLRILYGYMTGFYKQNEALGKLANMSINVEDPSTTKEYKEATEYLIKNVSVDQSDRVNNYHFKNTRCSTFETIVTFFEGWDDADSRKYYLDFYQEKYNGKGNIEDVDIRKIAEAFKECTSSTNYFILSKFEKTDPDIAFAMNNFKATIIMEYSQQRARQQQDQHLE